MRCIFDPLFQSFIFSAILSINSLPTFPYGTRKVFFRHFEISLHALSMVDKLTVNSICSTFRFVIHTLVQSAFIKALSELPLKILLNLCVLPSVVITRSLSFWCIPVLVITRVPWDFPWSVTSMIGNRAIR